MNSENKNDIRIWTKMDSECYCTLGLESNDECPFTCKECISHELIAEWTGII